MSVQTKNSDTVNLHFLFKKKKILRMAQSEIGSDMTEPVNCLSLSTKQSRRYLTGSFDPVSQCRSQAVSKQLRTHFRVAINAQLILQCCKTQRYRISPIPSGGKEDNSQDRNQGRGRVSGAKGLLQKGRKGRESSRGTPPLQQGLPWLEQERK